MNRFKHATAITAAGSATLLFAACGGEITPSDYDDNVPLRTVSTSAQENDGTANGTSADTTTAAGTGADGDTANSTEGNSGVVVNVTVNQETTNTNTATNNNTAANGCCGGCCGYHCCCDCDDDPNGNGNHDCGNGTIDSGEDCDYGRVCVGAGSNPVIAYEDHATNCFPGCATGEVCVLETTSSISILHCVDACTTNSQCGSGNCVVPDEWWNFAEDAYCDDACQSEIFFRPYCGNGTIDPELFEECDPGPSFCIPSGHLQAEYWAAPPGNGPWSWNGLWGNTVADPCPGGGCTVGQECVVRRVFPTACHPNDTYSCRPTCDQNALDPCAAASEICVSVNRLDPKATDGQHYCAYDCIEDTHTVCGP